MRPFVFQHKNTPRFDAHANEIVRYPRRSCIFSEGAEGCTTPSEHRGHVTRSTKEHFGRQMRGEGPHEMHRFLPHLPVVVEGSRFLALVVREEGVTAEADGHWAGERLDTLRYERKLTPCWRVPLGGVVISPPCHQPCLAVVATGVVEGPSKLFRCCRFSRLLPRHGPGGNSHDSPAHILEPAARGVVVCCCTDRADYVQAVVETKESRKQAADEVEKTKHVAMVGISFSLWRVYRRPTSSVCNKHIIFGQNRLTPRPEHPRINSVDAPPFPMKVAFFENLSAIQRVRTLTVRRAIRRGAWAGCPPSGEPCPRETAVEN